MSEHVVSDFNGRDDLLIRSIESLLEMDAKGILVPHGIGGHARTLLKAAKASIQAKPTPPASQESAAEAQLAHFASCVATLTAELAEAREQRDKLAQENLERAEAVIAQAANARNLADALKKLNNAARISGGVAGADKNLMDACENAERALSLAGTGRAVNAVLDVMERLRVTDARLHDVSVLCATAEQQRDSLREELEATDRLLNLHLNGSACRKKTEQMEQSQKECESLRDECERLREAIAGIARVNPEVPDAINNHGNPYQSQFLADRLAALSASGRDADGDGMGD